VLEKKELGIMIIAPLSDYSTKEMCVGFVDDINFNIDRPNAQ